MPPFDALAATLADVVAERRPRVVGIHGGQGSGKSTLAAALVPALAARGLRAAALSLDDVYLRRDARLRLAAAVHPLLATRGVPGTHDVALAHRTLDALLAADGAVEVPRFDKGADDRDPVPRTVPGPVDVVLFEGWCVGLPPLSEADLAEPVNALERDEDPDGTWRRFVNDQLRGPYAGLWARIDLLVVLVVPGMDAVVRWRRAQEAAVRGGPRALDDAGIVRFVRHYERWTRWGRAVLPGRADVVVRLGEDHEVREVAVRPSRGVSGDTGAPGGG